MNINLTFFVQIFNILTTMFLLKKILIEKVLIEIKTKKNEIKLLTEKLTAKKISAQQLTDENLFLWKRFKERNSMFIEISNNKSSYLQTQSDKDLFQTNIGSSESEQISESRLAKKFSDRIIKNIRETS